MVLTNLVKQTLGKSEEGLKNEILNALDEALSEVNIADDEISGGILEKIQSILHDINTETALKRSTIEPRFGQVIDSIDEIFTGVTKPHPQDFKEARHLIRHNLPAFVYYSNYGNLDSEIYLLHVIENMSRDNLGMGLSVSDTLLQGCQAVVVEGTSDQHYLSAIKNYLIGKGLIKPKREILFVPAGGVKGVGAVVSLITAKDEGLPYVILDSDSSGQGMLKQLSSNLYNVATDKIIMVGDIRSLKDAEVEDLYPTEFLAKIVRKNFLRGTDDDFDEVVEGNKPIVLQIQEFATKNNIKLAQGWKVELAKQANSHLAPRKIDVLSTLSTKPKAPILLRKANKIYVTLLRCF